MKSDFYVNSINIFWNNMGDMVFSNVGYTKTSTEKEEKIVGNTIKKINELVQKLHKRINKK